MYCSNCGNELKGNENYCSKCGQITVKAQSAEPDKKVTSSSLKLVIALAVVCLPIIIIAGANLKVKSPEEQLIGTWVCTTEEEWILTFKEDGSFYDSDSYFLYYTDVGTWDIPSDGILHFECVGDSDTLDYELKGNILTIYVTNSVNSSYSFQKSK